MRILLVIGDESLLQSTRRVFWQSHRTWEVVPTASGREALEALRRDRVDIVVSDLQLQDMEGAELLHRVREVQPGAVRIGLADHPMAEWLEKEEGDLHRLFIKPFETQFLIGAIAVSYTHLTLPTILRV